MSKTYLLIDLQNRQPAPQHVASWIGEDGEAWIFYGEQEVGRLAQYMELGDRISLVDISKPGKNSLDFHLVLYLGYLIARHEAGARFVVVAADGDYDPAIVHARSKGKQVERVEALGPAPLAAGSTSVRKKASPQALIFSAIPASMAIDPAPLAPKSKKEKSVELISSELLKDFIEAGKPRTLIALARRIQWRFGPSPVPDKVADVVTTLVTLGAIRITDGTVEYQDRAESRYF